MTALVRCSSARTPRLLGPRPVDLAAGGRPRMRPAMMIAIDGVKAGPCKQRYNQLEAERKHVCHFQPNYCSQQNSTHVQPSGRAERGARSQPDRGSYRPLNG